MSVQIMSLVLAVVTLSVVYHLISRSRSKKMSQFNLESLINVILGAYGIVLETNLIYKVATSPDLVRLLGDDTIALLLGAIAIIWVSLRQML